MHDKMFEYGLTGAVLLILLTSFLWVFRMLVTRGLGHFDEISIFMKKTVEVLARLAEEQERHREILNDISQEFRINPRR